MSNMNELNEWKRQMLFLTPRKNILSSSKSPACKDLHLKKRKERNLKRLTTQLLRGASMRSLSSNENVSEESGGVIRVLTYCKIRPRGSTNHKMRCKSVSQQIITRPPRQWMRNIKELIEWREARKSPLAFIKSTRPSCKAQKWKQCISGQNARGTRQVRNWKRNPPGKGTSTLKRVTASLWGLTRSLPFSYTNVMEYFQWLITCILCGKRKDSLYSKMCPDAY